MASFSSYLLELIQVPSAVLRVITSQSNAQDSLDRHISGTIKDLADRITRKGKDR